MSAFSPEFCPLSSCPTRRGAQPFRFRRSGTYFRAADGRRVQRFLCLDCRRRFSSQSFRLDYRLRKPHLNCALLGALASKVTHRQTARILRINRKTVHHRVDLFSRACREFHLAILARNRKVGGLSGQFSLDELETYEGDRRLRPVTVPVVIHRKTRFVVHVEVGAMPARGGLSALDRERKARQGPRPSESREKVTLCLRALDRAHHPSASVEIITDQKSTYPPIVKSIFGQRLIVHARESSRRRRNTRNVLFQINHTFAMMRDQVSRLVRRTWAASKLRMRLERHLWIWVAWRNYVRTAEADEPEETAAMRLKVVAQRLAPADLLRWRHPFLSPLPS